MTEFIQPGEILDFVAGVGGVVASAPLIVGGYFVVPLTSAAEGETYSGAVDGVFKFDAASHATTQAADQGAIAYWDATNRRITITATGNTKVGLFAAPKLSPAVEATVQIKPIV